MYLTGGSKNKIDKFTFQVIKFWKKETLCSGSGANWKVETASAYIHSFSSDWVSCIKSMVMQFFQKENLVNLTTQWNNLINQEFVAFNHLFNWKCKTEP